MTSFNGTFCALLGYRCVSEFEQQAFLDLVHPDDRSGLWARPEQNPRPALCGAHS